MEDGLRLTSAATTFCGLQLCPQKVKLLGPLEEDPRESRLRARNADLSQDEKFVQIRASLASVGGSIGKRKYSLRSQGTEAHEKIIRGLTSTCTPSSSSSVFSPDWSPSSPARSSRTFSQTMPSRWNTGSSNSFLRAGEATVDLSRSTKRLLQDMELASDDLLLNQSHRLRCEHLDKMHSWLERHQIKENSTRSSRGPAFLTYAKDERVMTGSLRVEPHERRYAPLPWATLKQQPTWLSKSLSTPSMSTSRAAQRPQTAEGVELAEPPGTAENA